MRRAAKVDANHACIVGALRACGASVQSLAGQADGCPDLLVGHHGVNLLIEVKDGSKIPSKRRLTEDQEKWHAAWKGRVVIVHSPEEAIAALVKNPSLETA